MVAPPNLEEFSKKEIKETLDEVRHPFEVAVFDSSNYFNFGSIVRTGHNFLMKKIYAVGLESYYKKACMSGRKYEEIEKISLTEFIEDNKNRNIIALERRQGVLQTEDLIHYTWPENPIMFFGSEKHGVPDEILDIATDMVSIPVYGLLNDHNVAVAAGIVMYDWVSKHYKH